jgi:hypothetical protein
MFEPIDIFHPRRREIMGANLRFLTALAGPNIIGASAEEG